MHCLGPAAGTGDPKSPLSMVTAMVDRIGKYSAWLASCSPRKHPSVYTLWTLTFGIHDLRGLLLTDWRTVVKNQTLNYLASGSFPDTKQAVTFTDIGLLKSALTVNTKSLTLELVSILLQ